MIDPRAIIDPGARLGNDVTIGPWTMVGPGVEIGDATTISSHVVLRGPTSIGRNNRIYQFASVGEDTPDLKYHGETTRLVIGDNNTIREGVTIHRGTVQGGGETRIGNDNLFMAYAHVAHDSVVGDHCIMVNNSAIGGHVTLGDWAIVGGLAGVHQYCQIGTHSFVALGSVVTKDVPAYVMVSGNPCEASGINVEGIRRRGFSSDDIAVLRRAYKILYRQGLPVEEALARLSDEAEASAVLMPLIESVRKSTRGIVR